MFYFYSSNVFNYKVSQVSSLIILHFFWKIAEIIKIQR